MSKQNITPSVPYDEELVERRRQEVAQRDIATMVLDDTLASVSREGMTGITPVSFSSMGGVQSHLLFRRNSGAALKQPINFVYTKETYIKKVLPTMVKSAEQFFGEENWVLGNYASLSESKTAVLTNTQKLYFDNYIRTWKGYLADLSLVDAKSSRENIQIAKLLSEKNSPLANIIKGISDNTTLNINNQLTAKAESKVDSKVSDWLSKSGLNKLLGSEGANEAKNE